MNRLLKNIHLAVINLQEKRIEQAAEKMILKPGSPEHGGIPWHGLGKPHLSWHDAGSVNFIPRALSLWNDPESHFYRHDELLEKIDFALDFVLRRLPPSGLLSMIYCNFSSPPDTGFAMYVYGPALENLRRSHDDFFRKNILPKLEKLTRRMGEGLINAGIHTPNHRWSNVQALAWTWRLFKIQEALDFAKKWLAEGIDLTKDGEFMERSLNYSNHSDRSLLSAAYVLERPDLIAAARKNLRLLPFLTHPDDTCVTDLSLRNDVGLDVHLDRFLESAYLLNALAPDSFSAMLLQKCSERLLAQGVDDKTYITPSSADLLPWIQLFPPEKQKLNLPEQWPENYVKIFGDEKTHQMRQSVLGQMTLPYDKTLQSHLSHPTHGASFVRIRRHDFSATLMTFNDSLASLRMGEARILGIYLSLSYFGQGASFASDLEAGSDWWTLKRPDLRAAYFGHLRHPISPLDMEYDQRDFMNENHLDWSVKVYELEHGLRFHFSGSGAIEKSGHENEVLAQLIIQFPSKGNLSGEKLFSANALPPVHIPGYIPEADENDFYLFEGEAIYSLGKNSITVSGGSCQHYLPLMLGDQVPRKNRRSVRINLLFPGEHILEIRCK